MWHAWSFGAREHQVKQFYDGTVESIPARTYLIAKELHTIFTSEYGFILICAIMMMIPGVLPLLDFT